MKKTVASSVHYLAMILLLLLCGCGYLIQPRLHSGMAQLEPGSYALDKQHTSVIFKINHLGFTDYLGRFNRMDAQLDFDPANIAAARLSAMVEIASIDVNNPDLEETLRGSSWFDAEHFPQALFRTQTVQVIDTRTADFIGDLTLHGVTKPFTLRVTFNAGGDDMLTGRYTLGFSASGQLQRSIFGMSYLVPAIGDQVRIEIFAEFQKQ